MQSPRPRDQALGHLSDASDRPSLAGALRHRPVLWLILSGAILIAGIALTTTWTVNNFRDRALQNSERELSNTALLLALHYDREIEEFLEIQNEIVAIARQAQQRSADAFSGGMATLAAHQMLRSRARGATEITALKIFDATGRLINASDVWPVPEISISEQDYFREHKAGTTQRITVALEHNALAGGWTTVLAQRLNDAHGEFLGVVTRALTPAHFERFLSQVSLIGDSAIAVHHSDGTLLTRHPHVEGMIGRNFRDGPTLQQALFDGDTTARLTSPVDGQERLVASHALSGLPIVMVATMTTEDALASWRSQTNLLVSVAVVSALVVTVILLLIVHQISKHHHATQRKLLLDKQRLDTAINNMSQGLLLFDAQARLVVCNQRYLDMYGLSPEIVKPGCSLRDVLEHRKSTGSVHGDVDSIATNLIDTLSSRRISEIHSIGSRSIEFSSVPVPGGGWVITHEDVTERTHYDEKISYLAHFDSLTDLPNRTMFRQRLENELQRAGRGEPFALLYIDIDEFKSINDTLGHPVGDELLKQVAVRLRDCVREIDFVARLGGDEFAVIQIAVSGADDATALVDRIYESIRQPYQCLGHQLSTDASIGIAIGPRDGADLDQLVKNADLAMYSAKAEGRRTFRFFEPEMDAAAKTRRQLEFDLRSAIAEHGFEIHYQPLVDLRSGAITGCEALLRWRHPTRGMISPAEFIPIAEDTGLINEIGAWTLATACSEAAKWDSDITLAVNISPVQFRQPSLALLVASVLGAAGLPAERLELEITEAVLIHDDDAALNTLTQLRGLGVKISLDDFGTGYSSLSYLQRFPFDKIKIDRSFIDVIDTTEGSTAIVQAVVNIAAARRMTTTAEGVETPRQREILSTLGCTQMQGWLFSPAVPATAFRKLLDSHPSTCAA
ncbi:diguanylate cyclase [Rhodopseudomonas palustris]|uniref:Diguanylate cyclase n=1 Tax=Rhodopseudomonas palustris TaxID=1076 RepID=A0A323UH16_RHOPL|nr:EAL domain-containing protein [Rhodopseudomonas palustris]PZA11403.1 diguanylate cyclase [Rhodopseudomonas palustris]